MANPAPLGDNGLRMLGEFEPGPDGKPATKAYRCPGGRWTLGLGATQWPNGDTVGPLDVCTEEQAEELTNWSVRKFAAIVDATVTEPISENERDAMILMAYNIGPEAFQNCSVVARLHMNPKDRQHAAEAFGMWCKATSSGPERYDMNDVLYTPIIGRKPGIPDAEYDASNHVHHVWIDRDGRPTRYQRAFPGLLRRHLSEACLFLGLDWRQACRHDTVSITSERIWDPKDKRWEDLVRKKTELTELLPVAKQYPLPALAGEGAGSAPAAAQPGAQAALPPNVTVTVIEDKPPVKEPAKPSPEPSVATKDKPKVSTTPNPASVGVPVGVPAGTKAPGAVQRPPAPIPPPAPPKPPAPPVPIGQQTSAVDATRNSADWASNCKDMWKSRRFYGLVLVMLGRLWMLKTGSNAVLNTVSDPLVTEMFSGFCVMIAGEIIQRWGEAKATRPLK